MRRCLLPPQPQHSQCSHLLSTFSTLLLSMLSAKTQLSTYLGTRTPAPLEPSCQTDGQVPPPTDTRHRQASHYARQASLERSVVQPLGSRAGSSRMSDMQPRTVEGGWVSYWLTGQASVRAGCCMTVVCVERRAFRIPLGGGRGRHCTDRTGAAPAWPRLAWPGLTCAWLKLS